MAKANLDQEVKQTSALGLVVGTFLFLALGLTGVISGATAIIQSTQAHTIVRIIVSFR